MIGSTLALADFDGALDPDLDVPLDFFALFDLAAIAMPPVANARASNDSDRHSAL
ncbi:MAG: hypothetical protein WB677_01600 [Xanthobacteraceae bacterium]